MSGGGGGQKCDGVSYIGTYLFVMGFHAYVLTWVARLLYLGTL